MDALSSSYLQNKYLELILMFCVEFDQNCTVCAQVSVVPKLCSEPKTY